MCACGISQILHGTHMKHDGKCVQVSCDAPHVVYGEETRAAGGCPVRLVRVRVTLSVWHIGTFHCVTRMHLEINAFER